MYIVNSTLRKIAFELLDQSPAGTSLLHTSMSVCNQILHKRNLQWLIHPASDRNIRNFHMASYTGMRRITTFRSTTDRIHVGGPFRL